MARAVALAGRARDRSARRRRAAAAAIAWIEAHCVHSRGPLRGRSFRLLPWQRELLWRLLELRPRPSVAPEVWPRRYRRALIGAPGANGKSELLAALGLWLLLDDAGPAPQIACAGASDREAAVAFGAARTMCELSPTLRALTERWERVIEVPLRQGARLLRVAGGAPADAEARYSAVLLDDLQRWTLPRQVAGHAALASGPPGGPEPLLIQMASAGRERETPCYREYAYGRALREGAVDDRRFFFAWFEAPEGLDPASEQAWRAANPSAGVTVGFEDYREQLGRAPESELRRAHLNQWVELEAPWLPRGAWAACRGDERLQEGALTFVAIDASTKVDSTAVAVLQPQGELEVVRCRLWERPPEPRGRRGGERWQLPIEELKAHVRALCERFAVRAIGYDPAFVTWTAEELLAEGLPMIEIPQTHARMAPASQALYERIVGRRLRHDGDPALARHVREAAAAPAPDGGWRLAKGRARQPIDGAIALAMCALLAEGERLVRRPPTGDG